MSFSLLKIMMPICLGWNRCELIEKMNADWKDLAESIGVTTEMVENARKSICAPK